ncbi:hypothetical protein [Methanosarcina sp. WH1]|uniref:hypothetical protein n=1 Tax=Methanosarcina sp. WH1 TaxID=1434102 RepID=UPI00064F471E|nr:hypothetical protein [Methanosarcina sp. WH1]
MRIIDSFEHMEKLSYECKKFKDIDELLSEYDYDLKDWYDSDRIRLDIYMWMLQLLRASSCVRPIAVYVALLENGYKSSSEPRLTREVCILTIAKLQLESLLTCELEEEGIVTDYTKFEPVRGDRFDYFSSRIFEISRNRMIFNHGDARISIDDIDRELFKIIS